MDGNSSDHTQVSRGRALLFSAIILVSFLVLAELAARVAFYFKDGRNPYFLTYGFVDDIDRPSSRHGGYTKFPPNSVKRYKVGAEIVPATINADGFRDADDFVRPKPAGELRIATLGASSTFGYENRDEETYPHQLELLLAQRLPGRSVEVLNLGIPQARISNIVALARAELPSLHPDIVTFYEGFNDALMPKAREEASGLYRLKDWAYFHSVAARVLSTSVKAVYLKLTAATNRDLIGAHSLTRTLVYGPETIEALRRQVGSEFVRHLRDLASLCDSIGSRLVLVTQPITLVYDESNPTSPEIRPYRDELQDVRADYAGDSTLTAFRTVMLVHGDLIDSVRALARERGEPVVEGIDALTPQRRLNVTSGVHLTRRGNALLAEAIADRITVLADDGAR